MIVFVHRCKGAVRNLLHSNATLSLQCFAAIKIWHCAAIFQDVCLLWATIVQCTFDGPYGDATKTKQTSRRACVADRVHGISLIDLT